MALHDCPQEPMSPRQAVNLAISAWSRLLESQPRAWPPAQMLTCVQASDNDDTHAVVSLSFPKLPMTAFVDWVGPRLVYWPRGIVHLHRTAIVSSRIGQRKDLKPWWFDALRTAVIRCDSASECLCYTEGTTTAPFVVRGSELFGIRRLRIDVSAESGATAEDLVDWLHNAAAAVDTAASELESVVRISPPMKTNKQDTPTVYLTSGQLPVTDTAAMLAAERLLVLWCRRGGHIERLAERRLKDNRFPRTVLVASLPETETQQVSESLVRLGAIPWILQRPSSSPTMPIIFDRSEAEQAGEKHGPLDYSLHAVMTTGMADSGTSAGSKELWSRSIPFASGPLDKPADWLCHWTRPCFGPWTGQSEDEFLDELILGCATADRSAFAALLRIIEQKTIRAAGSIRGAAPTVSFTAVPLAEFRSHRVFRRHKHRYDFEPWGVAVHKSAVERWGGQPVTYVDTQSESDSQQKASRAAAKFLQPRTNASGTIDWSREREWRVCGDVHLADVSPHDVVVFVNDPREQSVLRELSPWPVLIVPNA